MTWIWRSDIVRRTDESQNYKWLIEPRDLMNKITKIGFLIIVIASSYAHAGSVSWQQALVEESTWSRVTFAGTLLVASQNSLAHYASDSGEQLWLRDDMHRLAQFNVRDITGSPFLIVSEHVSNTRYGG